MRRSTDRPVVTVLFDVTRLYMRASGTSPTGIDRVNEAYGRWLLSLPGVEVIPVCTWGGVVATQSVAATQAILRGNNGEASGIGDTWSKLVAALSAPPGAVRVLRARPSGGGMMGEVSAKVGAARRYASAGTRALSAWRPRTYQPGDIYLNVSHYGLENPGLLRRLAARGVRPMVMLHDLIPIAHPEYCSPSAAVWHRRRVDAVLDHADLVVTNSSSTAVGVTSHARRDRRRIPPVCVAPLGLEAPFLAPRNDALAAGPYFLCVGTIEPRKNLTFLLTLWRHLAERMGDATPPLVLVGRRGWENESVIDHLERSPPIQRFVHEATGLCDQDLARLIGGARALLSPSFIEGFNLPVAEALALGTPVIASDIPVHRELAREAHLLDPVDGPAWLSAIMAATARRPIQRPCPANSWSDHFTIVGRATGLWDPDHGVPTRRASVRA